MKSSFPLTPTQIHEYKTAKVNYEKAKQMPAGDVPLEGVSHIFNVNLKPGSAMTLINMAYNNITALKFTDINGTSWLDTFSKGVPTLILVDERIYKIRREFKKYYEKLKEKNIIFTDPKKLANFINDNFKNINHYWTSRAIDSLRKKIVKQYCNKEDKPFEKLKRLLKDD